MDFFAYIYVERMCNPLHQQHHFINCNFLCFHVFSLCLYLLRFRFTLASRRCPILFYELDISPHSALLYCLCENQALGVCTLTQTPTITLNTGLKPVPGFGRMPLSLSLSQQELEGSEAVSYDDIAPADQLIIVNLSEKKKIHNY